MGIFFSNIIHYSTDSYKTFMGSLRENGSDYGKIIFEDSSIYVGNIHNNLLNGHGICQYIDGTIYEGNWTNGLRCGNGKLYLTTGETYEGDFDTDEINGKGIYTYKDGSYYEGDLKFGKRVGIGTLYNSRKDIIYFGRWRADKQFITDSRVVSPEISRINPIVNIPHLDLTAVRSRTISIELNPRNNDDNVTRQQPIKREFAPIVPHTIDFRNMGINNPMFTRQ